MNVVVFDILVINQQIILLYDINRLNIVRFIIKEVIYWEIQIVKVWGGGERERIEKEVILI